jgi:diguanylate cyclase (GGDEF)-like protein/PAS domain S-box-containing protein
MSESRLLILAATPHALDAEALDTMLAPRPCRVVVSAGAEALALVDRHAFSLVVVDVDADTAVALDLVAAVRARRTPPELPILAISARADAALLAAALARGASDGVARPIDSPLARARIESLLALAEATTALRESRERYALAAQGLTDGLWDWDLRRGDIYFSPRWKAMLGAAEADIGPTPDEWFTRVHPEDLELLKAEIDAHLEGQTPQFENQHRLLHADGTYRWILSRGLAVRDDGGLPYRMAGSQSDITEGKVLDPLTGLPNRILYMDRLRRALDRARRQPEFVFAVLFVDLDRFKLINDSRGHLAGDRLLIALAKRLEHCLRAEDMVARLASENTIARLGGDEFTVLLEGIRDTADAIRVADRLHEALQPAFDLDGHETFVSASIGIATSETGYTDVEELLRDADTAMYRAKALGKARSELFDHRMRDEAVSRLALETDLRRAVERQEFRLHYQPIVSLRTGAIAGFEALLRWQHPVRGLITPSEFIAAAEETGLIVPINTWALEGACQQLRLWLARHPDRPLSVSVNLSGRQFIQGQAGLIREIAGILGGSGLPPSALKLEITESMIVGSLDSGVSLMTELKNLGVELAIDDFGTGYSSLSYLPRFPIDFLKIDRSFIATMESDGSEIVRAIIGLAHNLGLDVVAEGVETDDQVTQLLLYGCEYAQGHRFARPMTARDAEALIAGEGAAAASLRAAVQGVDGGVTSPTRR